MSHGGGGAQRRRPIFRPRLGHLTAGGATAMSRSAGGLSDGGGIAVGGGAALFFSERAEGAGAQRDLKSIPLSQTRWCFGAYSIVGMLSRKASNCVRTRNEGFHVSPPKVASKSAVHRPLSCVQCVIVIRDFWQSFIGTFCGFFVGTPWPRDIHPHKCTATFGPSTDDRLWAAPSTCSQSQHGATTCFRRGPSAGTMDVYSQPARCLQ